MPAFKFYYGLRSSAVQLAVLVVTKSELEKHGLVAELSVAPIIVDGATLQFWVLRAAKERSSTLLREVHGEQRISNVASFWAREVEESRPTYLPFVHVDREQAQRISKKLGLATTERRAPWELLQLVNDDNRKMSDDLKEELLSRVNPTVFADVIAERIRAQDYAPPARMSHAVEGDQCTRALFVRGEFAPLQGVPFDEAVAIIDTRIDELYEREGGAAQRSHAARADAEKEAKKRARAKAKASRRRNRH